MTKKAKRLATIFGLVILSIILLTKLIEPKVLSIETKRNPQYKGECNLRNIPRYTYMPLDDKKCYGLTFDGPCEVSPDHQCYIKCPKYCRGIIGHDFDLKELIVDIYQKEKLSMKYRIEVIKSILHL